MKNSLILIALLAAGGAQASSPAAWQAQDKAMVKACTKASGLHKVTHTGKPVLFSDQVGYTALQLDGEIQPRRGKALKVKMLCLYHRKDGKTETSEILP